MTQAKNNPQGKRTQTPSNVVKIATGYNFIMTVLSRNVCSK